MERTFKAADRHGSVMDFELKAPSLAEENEGERQYRIAYSRALVEGVFPREKLREIMKEHGMWTEDDDKEIKKAVGKIALLQLELKNAEAAGDSEKCLEIANDISDARRRMWELFLVQQSVYMNSAEGVAELIKTEVIMAACTMVQSTGQRYWKDYAEYVRERDLNEKSTVYAHVVELQSKILDDARVGLMSDYPEYQYLKTTEERMLDREVQEEVVKELQSRVTKAIDEDKEKQPTTVRKKRVKKVASRSKKSTKRSSSKTK